jgi:hypothetical protein
MAARAGTPAAQVRSGHMSTSQGTGWLSRHRAEVTGGRVVDIIGVQSGATVSLPLREPRPPRGLCGCALEWLGRQVGNLPIQGDAAPARLEQSGEYLQATCGHWHDTFTLLPVTTGPPARS